MSGMQLNRELNGVKIYNANQYRTNNLINIIGSAFNMSLCEFIEWT